MPYQIIASDLDKTLLRLDHSISPENWAAIERLTQRGVHFVPSSGRAFDELPPEIKDSPLIRYYITSDGAVIYDKKTDTFSEIPMPKALGTWVLDTVYRFPTCMMVHSDTKSYVDARTNNPTDYASFNMSPSWINFCMTMDEPVADLKAFAYSLPSIQSVVPFFRTMEDLEACRRILTQDPALTVVQTDPHNLEIFSSTAGKGNALVSLARQLGIDPAQTIAIGDSTNDCSMIQSAGLGLAVENAHPEVKAIADAVVCHHMEHAIAYIEKHYF